MNATGPGPYVAKVTVLTYFPGETEPKKETVLKNVREVDGKPQVNSLGQWMPAEWDENGNVVFTVRVYNMFFPIR